MAETTPVDFEAATPDEELAAVNADLDDGTDVAVLVDAPPPPLGKSWAFDFSAERFERAEGAHGPIQTFGDQTLAQWCLKALYTAQGAHPIYPSDFGMRNPNRWYGRHLDAADLTQLEADVVDALTYHPRIVSVEDFEFTQGDDDEFVEFSCTVVKDDGSTVPLSNRDAQ